jgi:hypothetical protein
MNLVVAHHAPPACGRRPLELVAGAHPRTLGFGVARPGAFERRAAVLEATRSARGSILTDAFTQRPVRNERIMLATSDFGRDRARPELVIVAH